jgi:hypothetical protein
MSTPEQTTPSWMSDPEEPVTTGPPRERGGRTAVVAVVALVLGLAGGFGIRRVTAPEGPESLAEAMQMAAAGDLPTGDMQGGPVRIGGQGPGQDQLGGPPAGAPLPGGPGGGRGPGGLQGEVTAVDGDTVTLKTQAGEVKVQLTDKTTVARSTKGTAGDVKVGATVSVRPDFDSAGAANAGSAVVAGSVTVES